MFPCTTVLCKTALATIEDRLLQRYQQGDAQAKVRAWACTVFLPGQALIVFDVAAHRTFERTWANWTTPTSRRCTTSTPSWSRTAGSTMCSTPQHPGRRLSRTSFPHCDRRPSFMATTHTFLRTDKPCTNNNEADSFLLLHQHLQQWASELNSHKVREGRETEVAGKVTRTLPHA